MLGPRLRDRDLDDPALPADLLVTARQPGLPALLLKELDRDLATAAVAAAAAAAAGASAGRGPLRVQLPGQGGGALLDHGLELDVLDVGEGQVEDVVGARGERGKESVEEDGVENPWDVSDVSPS